MKKSTCRRLRGSTLQPGVTAVPIHQADVELLRLQRRREVTGEVAIEIKLRTAASAVAPGLAVE